MVVLILAVHRLVLVLDIELTKLGLEQGRGQIDRRSQDSPPKAAIILFDSTSLDQPLHRACAEVCANTTSREPVLDNLRAMRLDMTPRGARSNWFNRGASGWSYEKPQQDRILRSKNGWGRLLRDLAERLLPWIFVRGALGLRALS